MPKQKPVAKETSDQGSRAKVEPSPDQARRDLSNSLAPPFADLTAAADDGSVQAQATRLGDASLQSVQRQELAAQIGRQHGNRHLQRVVASAEAAQKAEPTAEIERAAAAQADLGAGGRPLDGGVRQNMEGAFGGTDFGAVRVHTDGPAAELTQALDAQAVTVGKDIAFRRGEYQPGTAVGEALIAHELAHVAQQRGAAEVQRDADISAALEADAQRSAVGALVRMWQGARGTWANARQNATPRMRTGLQLQRCSKMTDEQKKKLEEAKRILKTMPTGREALAIMDKYKVDVVIVKAGSGSVFSSSDNAVEIDDGETATEAALTFVHEMNHAKYYHEGKHADVKKLGREEYIKKAIEEEAEGTVKSIEAKIELEEGKKIDVSKTGFPLEKEYRKAYKDAVDAAKAIDPKKPEEELKKIGRAAGKKRVTKGFMDGEVQGSRSKKPYTEIYGAYWDKNHT